jgi:hypothetical protein
MKKLKIILVFFFTLSLSTYGQNKTFTFKGQVHSYGNTLKGASIKVFLAGDLVYETVSKGAGKIEFETKSEQEYMVEISKEGLRTKTIWVNTRGTEKLKFKMPVFAFDIHLKKEKVTRYDELSEIPVTLIKYQPSKRAFYMDKTYEEAVENKKKKIKNNTIQPR